MSHSRTGSGELDFRETIENRVSPEDKRLRRTRSRQVLLDLRLHRQGISERVHQYAADTRQVSSNIRFNFIHHPLSDLYVVYNDRRDTDAGRLMERSFIVKLTNLFDF